MINQEDEVVSVVCGWCEQIRDVHVSELSRRCPECKHTRGVHLTESEQGVRDAFSSLFDRGKRIR